MAIGPTLGEAGDRTDRGKRSDPWCCPPARSRSQHLREKIAAHAESTEAAYLHPFASFKSPHHLVENALHDLIGALPGDHPLLGQRRGELGFRHTTPSPNKPLGSTRVSAARAPC